MAEDGEPSPILQPARSGVNLTYGFVSLRRRDYNAGFMRGFDREGAVLSCDGISLATIAEAVGTPCYVYSGVMIRDRLQQLVAGFGDYPHAVHYALKANSSLAVLRVVREAGGLADANSGGEIEVARRAGYAPEDIVFTGVGKTPAELDQAVALGVKTINAESAGELERVAGAARQLGVSARVALRVNPDIAADSHPHISTGLSRHKFGVPLADAREILRTAARWSELRVVGLHVHVGSQMLGLDPVRQATDKVLTLTSELADDGIQLEHLDLGGGLGIQYNDEVAPSPADYAAVLVDLVRDSGLSIVIEPGRAVVGAAGVLVASAVDVKPRPDGKLFVVLDAGMSELLRPALYGAYHWVRPVLPGDGEAITCDVVGPICETSDLFGADRELPRPEVGDLMAVLDAGAYGSAMANNYNRHPLPAEVMVDGGEWRLSRRRQTIDDQLSCEEG